MILILISTVSSKLRDLLFVKGRMEQGLKNLKDWANGPSQIHILGQAHP